MSPEPNFNSNDASVQGGAGYDIGIFQGVTSGMRNFDFASRGLEELRWVTNGNTYTLIPGSGNTRVETVTDTALTEASFQQRTTTLDSLLREELVNRLNDDGTRFIYDYDPSNASAVNYILQVFAVSGALDYTDTNYDAGSPASRVIRDEDQGNANAWTSITTTYVNGLVDYQDNVFDDGTRNIFDGDQANGFDWLSVQTIYANGGAVDYQDTKYDDGRRVIFDSDQAVGFVWQTQSTTYAPGGALDLQNTLYDDNTRIIFDWDNNNAFYWSTFESFYNNAGNLTTQRITRDNGQIDIFNF